MEVIFMSTNYYKQELSHKGLNKYKIIKAAIRYELEQKVTATMAQWNEQWKRKCMAEQKRLDVEKAMVYAEKVTNEAEIIQAKIVNLLENKLVKL